MTSYNIFPEFHSQLQRADKERLLGQTAQVLWLYGLSGSGKSTLANMLERKLHAEGRLTRILDGDNIRTGLNAGLGFTDADRRENIRRVAEVAKLFLETGVITIVSFICPLREMRQMARSLIGAENFTEVYIAASFEACARRDVKGLYAKADQGGVAHFTGKDSLFEPPSSEDDAVIIDTEQFSPRQCCERLYQLAIR